MAYLKMLTNTIKHRPWPLPAGNWTYYQEWNNALFLHWKIPVDLLRPFVPSRLEPDETEGSAWVSLVAFTMEKIRPRLLPAVPAISNFHELNLRTYVSHNGKKGVYFLSIEAQKTISAFVARSFSGLPYRKADMNRMFTAAGHQYNSYNKESDFRLNTTFTTGEALTDRQNLDTWLTERYCLYTETKKELFRFDIHHETWPLLEVSLTKLEVQYRIGSFDLSVRPPDLVHYSTGVRVLAWNKTLL
jgi:uncharacterized protein YqjF (DUF2071 family)